MIRCDRVMAVVLVLGAIVSSWPAPAEANRMAKMHYKTGQAYYQEGAYSKAIVEFTKAYELAQKPALLYNVGQCHERLGSLGKAIDFFQRYLAESGRKDPALQQKIKNLQSRLRQTGIRISCTVEGATVTVDGREVGKTPLPEVIVINPGQHKLTVSKDGFTTYSLAVSVVAGAAVTINAELEPTTTKQPDKQPDKVGTGQQKQTDATVVAKPRKRLWTWIFFGVAGASLGAAAIFGGLALRNANDAPASEGSKADSARNMALATDVLLGVGIASAVTATVLLFVEGRSESAEKPAAAIRPLIGPAYVGAAGSF